MATSTPSGDDPGAVTIAVQRLDPVAPLPGYAHDGDAGADLVSTCEVVLQPGERAVVPTGLAVAIPAGWAGFVHPRSGLAVRHGLALVNAPGTIDSGYRGEVKVVVLNTDRSRSLTLSRGERIAQLVLQRVARARFVEAEVLPTSVRGDGGFGSTGRASRGEAADVPSSTS